MRGILGREALRRGLIGLPWGVVINIVITLAISAAAGTGSYYAVTPALASLTGSEVGAMALQTLLCALLGMIGGMLSVIWQIERWSLLRQTAVFFAACLGAMMIVELLCGWIEPSWTAIGRAVAIFSALFVIQWFVLFFWYRRGVSKLNEKLREQPKQ
ncbi:MAG: DUF3021 domain-containing protein [Clostridia bacterium]|nr:DUF3021 domain-containing protein [Clostridia bacterium]